MPRGEDGYRSLNDYSLVADGHAGALVGSDGEIDWFAAPQLDDAPLCAALLDPEDGGSITLEPTTPCEASVRYLPDTMAVQTTYRCATGTVEVTDVLNRGLAGPLPWTELARRIDVLDGEVPMRWRVRLGHRLGSGRPWIRRHDGAPLIEASGAQVCVVTDHAGEAEVGSGEQGEGDLRAEFVATDRASGLVTVLVNSGAPLPAVEPEAVYARIEITLEFWRRWAADIRYDGPGVAAVRRSAMTIKALTRAPEDGIAAALTTSLPEHIGGMRNYDYRFGWARDHAFALDAMARLHMTVEVHGAVTWMLRALRATAPDVRSLYRLNGTPAPAEQSAVEGVPGYRGSTPVRVGNGAADQLQIGAYGHLVDAVWRYARHGGYLDPESAEALAAVADRICDIWRREDAGLWELGETAHYTSSKMGAWVALDRAIRLAQDGQLAGADVTRWTVERRRVREWTDEHCWSPTKQSYTFYAGTDELDAAVLLAARDGYLAGDDPRLRGTIDAIRTELSAGDSGSGRSSALLYRYSGMRGQEGAFLACSFWLIEALALAGDTDEAGALLERALGYAGTTGLYTEEIDPQSLELLGNLPQVLTHLSLIGAATTLSGV